MIPKLGRKRNTKIDDIINNSINLENKVEEVQLCSSKNIKKYNYVHFSFLVDHEKNLQTKLLFFVIVNNIFHNLLHVVISSF